MRIDKLLWFLRLASSRGFAQDWVEAGHIRVNGRRIERSSATVREGDVLVLPMRQGVKVIELVCLPTRRGPAPEAQGCYRVLDGSGDYRSGLDGRGQPPLARPETDT